MGGWGGEGRGGEKWSGLNTSEIYFRVSKISTFNFTDFLSEQMKFFYTQRVLTDVQAYNPLSFYSTYIPIDCLR